MRKILFKAKRIDNGEWAQGNVFFGENGECEICIGTPRVRITYDVDPETVCQYTGFDTDDGTPIFYGDIISLMFGGYPIKRIVTETDMNLEQYKRWQVVDNIHDPSEEESQ